MQVENENEHDDVENDQNRCSICCLAMLSFNTASADRKYIITRDFMKAAVAIYIT